MKQILLITLGLSIFLWADFTRDDNGIVTNNTNKLQWQDNAIGNDMLWKDATAYCKNLELNGDGWRLPSLNELKTIYDGNKKIATVDGFMYPSSNGHWSSTPIVPYAYDTWGMYLYHNFSYWDSQDSYCSVRCVRDRK